MNNLVFLGSLPRSGSTLLCNIMAQNPAVHVTPTNGVSECIFRLRQTLSQVPEFKAQNQEEMMERMLGGMRGFIRGFYEQELGSGKLVIDKSRGWVGCIDIVEKILGKKIKIICPIRDLREILASFERLHRTYPAFVFSQEQHNFADWQTVAGRIGIWARGSEPVGSAFNRLKDVFSRGLQDRCLFVRYTDLVRNPAAIMKNLYEFLGVSEYKHDFENVEQVTVEDDSFFGIPSLHKIRTGRVVAPDYSWKDYIPEDLGQNLLQSNAWFYQTFYPERLR
jgi:sulfotransferase